MEIQETVIYFYVVPLVFLLIFYTFVDVRQKASHNNMRQFSLNIYVPIINLVHAIIVVISFGSGLSIILIKKIFNFLLNKYKNRKKK